MKDVDLLLDTLVRVADNDDFGAGVLQGHEYSRDQWTARLSTSDDPNNNDWHCTAEFTCKNEDSGDSFSPTSLALSTVCHWPLLR